MDQPGDDSIHRLELCARGRVQGVGFRYFVRLAAKNLSLDGWVRNEPDGSVRILAEGRRDDLERLKYAVRRGPPSARVDSLEEEWTRRKGDLTGFTVRG